MKVLLIAICISLCIFLLLKLILKSRAPKVGCIRINTSDPEKDIYTLELNVPFGELDKQKEVLFEIKHE